MSLKKAFGTNKDKEKAGVWITVCSNEDGTICRFRIARMGQRNKQFMAKIAKARNALKGADEDSEIAIRTSVEAIFGTVLLGWEHVKDYRQTEDPTKEMEFNIANVAFLFTDLPDVADLITQESMKLDNFKDEETAQTVKNSFPSTNTN